MQKLDADFAYNHSRIIPHVAFQPVTMKPTFHSISSTDISNVEVVSDRSSYLFLPPISKPGKVSY